MNKEINSNSFASLFKEVKIIDVSDFDDFVVQTYGRPYSFQQQDGCKSRGIEYFTVPVLHPEDFEKESIKEEVNGNEMGVRFKAWPARDPDQPLNSKDGWDRNHGLDLFWERNFYPHIDMLINDLYNKGLIEAGEYAIDIDW